METHLTKTESTTMPHISVIIPAYNEAPRIGGTLQTIQTYFSKNSRTYEIIVVDDGSTDNSLSVLQACAKNIPALRVLALTQNGGKGHAVKEGMLQARGEYSVFMDADNSVTIDNLDTFITVAKEGYDVVIGSIAIKGSVAQGHSVFYRRILGMCSRFLVKTIAVPGIEDTQRGFKLFSKRAVKDIFPRQTIDRFGFDIELLAIARIKGYKIKELPVLWNNPKTTTVGFGAYLDTLKELAKIKMNVFFGRYSK